MRPLRIVAYVAAGLIGLIVIALVLVVVFVDPNDYRDDIEKMVEEKTGRELTLSGDLKLSVFPWIALESGPASLGDAPGFGPEPFVSIQRSARRRAPAAAAARQSRSRQRAARRCAHPADHRRERPRQLGGSRQERSERRRRSRERGRPKCRRSRAWRSATRPSSMENRQEKSRREVRDFNLKTGRLASGEPFDSRDRFRARSGPVAVGQGEARCHGHCRSGAQRAPPRRAEIDVTVSGQGYPADGVPVQVRAKSLEADIGQELYSARWPDGEDHLEKRRTAGCRRAGHVQREGLQRESRVADAGARRPRRRCGRRARHRQSHRRGDSRCADAARARSSSIRSRCASGCRSSASTRRRPPIRTC